MECGGYLQRANPKGVAGIWECRPACGVKFSSRDEALIAAIERAESSSGKESRDDQ